MCVAAVSEKKGTRPACPAMGAVTSHSVVDPPVSLHSIRGYHFFVALPPSLFVTPSRTTRRNDPRGYSGNGTDSIRPRLVATDQLQHFYPM
mmetsp:Transcript_2206/g.4721  ORF Transcript_2206/g.4721 Transcript_2206/m.4721 type:complete len:91 (-) Transcript_2206:340-612(-)